MGKVDAESNINHFSHLHPLKLVSLQPSTSDKITTCAACTKEAAGLVYICESCSYCLHKPCSAMPQNLIHKADQSHSLTLLPTPAYAEAAFQCNACGVQGTGFCYHCAECQIDLHTVCAFMRSSVKSHAHDHILELCFEPPYENNAFICDVCGGSGSNHWLYRCDPCEFDSHLKCVKGPKLQQQPVVKSQKGQQPQKGLQRMDRKGHPQKLKTRSVHHPTSADPYPPPPVSAYEQQQQRQVEIRLAQPYPFMSQSSHQLQYCNTDFPRAFPVQPTKNDTVQQVVHSVVEGLIEGAANQIGQAILQGALGI